MGKSDVDGYVIIRKIRESIFSILPVHLRQCEILTYTGIYFNKFEYTKACSSLIRRVDRLMYKAHTRIWLFADSSELFIKLVIGCIHTTESVTLIDTFNLCHFSSLNRIYLTCVLDFPFQSTTTQMKFVALGFPNAALKRKCRVVVRWKHVTGTSFWIDL
jgi:hypothetical protein